MVVQLDTLIAVALEKATMIAPFTHVPQVGIRRVAVDIIPDGISLVSGTRELVRSGHLTAAFILQRPIWERAVTLQYLFEHPHVVELWERGWPYKSRPKLREMMISNSGIDASVVDLVALIEEWNSVVHGDPDAANLLSTPIGSGVRGRSPSRQVNDQRRCGEICALSASALIVFVGMMDAIFMELR